MVRARQPRTRGRASSTCRTYGLFVRNTQGNSRSKLHHRPFLEDTNLVGDIHSLVLARKTHERLLEAESRDDGVDVLALDVVELVDGVADLSLVGTEIHEEGEDVLRLRYECGNGSPTSIFFIADSVTTGFLMTAYTSILLSLATEVLSYLGLRASFRV